MSKKNTNRNSNIKIPEDVRDFSSYTLKKYKKRNDGYDVSKKELKEDYYAELLSLMPAAVKFVIRYGHINDDEVQETKGGCMEKFVDEDFLKALKKAISKDQLDDDQMDAVKLFPIILKEALEVIAKTNTERVAAGENNVFDNSDIIDICRRIFSLSKKKMKKFKELGLDDAVVFDLMCAIPHKSALSSKISSTHYRIRVFYETVYELAKTKNIPFADVVDIMVPEEYISAFIMYALLERKERFGRLNEQQKIVYSQITNWAIKMMEKSSKDQIKSIVTTYANARKKDESQGKDSPRRYPIGQVSEVDYPHIAAVIKEMSANDATLSKYLV